jgi:transposase-like protein
MRERKTVKHTVYTIEEKEEILNLYLSGKKSSEQLAREYDLDSPKRIRVWRDMKLKYGRIVDRRGKILKAVRSEVDQSPSKLKRCVKTTLSNIFG